MVPAVVWLVLGVVLIAAEVLSGDFVLLMLGGAAMAAAGASFLVLDSPVVGGVVFLAASALLVFAGRPALRHRLERGMEHSVMHHRALVGGPAVVVARVDGHGGRVRIGGDVWSARAYAGDDVIEEGRKVTVVDISGATALVMALD